MGQRPAYVLVTPARNEQATIEITIQSVTSQTILPDEWIIVSDGSTDRTDAIVAEHARSHPFIRLLRLDCRPARNFASVVNAIESGIGALKTEHYDFLGLLDADVRFQSDYFERLMAKFAPDPRLGLAGGWVLDVVGGRRPPERQFLKDVAGAAQFFRRECFAALGGLVAIPEGGWDAITNVQARLAGYRTRTFTDLVVDHLKPRNSAEGGAVRRKWQLGVRDFALGYYFVFEAAKCAARWRETPFVIGALARLAGFSWSCLSRRKRVMSRALITAVRKEQRRRILLGDDPPEAASGSTPADRAGVAMGK
jgi:biofilm PGA synthesis N-glycosyltransferase PgaC